MLLGSSVTNTSFMRQCMSVPERPLRSAPTPQQPRSLGQKQAARPGIPNRGRAIPCGATKIDRLRSRIELATAVDKTMDVLMAPAMAAALPPFHLAFPVHSIDAARDFYGGKLGCPEGRSAKTWVDFSLYGHQIVCHHVEGYEAAKSANAVDGDAVPVPHFGLALSVPQFQDLAQRVRDAGITFIIEPHLRFEGQPGEQYTMFFQDPSGNSLEFKAMTNPKNLFAKYTVES